VNGSSDKSHAGSATFHPTHAGQYCFRAEYSGDANYATAHDGSTGECFTVLQPKQPSATISSPKANAVYAVGQTVKASYSCDDATQGPGIDTCQGTAANGHAANTATRGVHKFKVTAVSKDGQHSVATIQYTVAGPPIVKISSPANGATYGVGKSVPVKFTCAEDRYGTGLANCNGPSSVKTSKLGTFPFTVTAISNDGQRTVRTVHYHVGTPTNRFVVSNVQGHQGGRVTFAVRLPGGGKVSVLELASRRNLPHPKSGSFTFARLQLNQPGAGTIHLDVRPGKQGHSALQQHPSLRIRLMVTFRPVNGKGRTLTFKRVRVTR
jgi:hypothetical protein